MFIMTGLYFILFFFLYILILINRDVVDIKASLDEVLIGDYINEINLIHRGDIVWKLFF